MGATSIFPIDICEDSGVPMGQLAVGGESEQLVAKVHQDAVIASGVVGEGGLELGGHEGGVACGFQEMVQAGEQLVAGR
jgi:hypothetical protein